MLFRIPPSCDHIKVFGCLFYAHNLQRQKDKFEAQSRKCIFIRYPRGQKGWRVYEIKSGNLFVSGDVIFAEDIFPFVEQMGHEGEKTL